jgi:hypothetical protein
MVCRYSAGLSSANLGVFGLVAAARPLVEATAAMPETGLRAVMRWLDPDGSAAYDALKEGLEGAHEHEAKEHDLPLVRQGRA